MLDPAFSRLRQKRLLEQMAARRLDAVVAGWNQHVYYFTAYRPFWQHQAAFVLFADGKTTAVAPTGATPAPAPAADRIVEFEASWTGTNRQDQPAVIADAVVEQLRGRGVRRMGCDASAVSSQLLLRWEGEAEAVDPVLWQMRRQKDPDEMVLIRKAFACVDAMYARARQIMAPGIDEIEVFAQLHSAAVTVAGEPLTDLLGNDFVCGAAGGPARGGKKARAGEIYILDVGPAYRGYFSDASRGFAVDGKPTEAQLKVHAVLCQCISMVEQRARAGMRCRELFAAVDEQLKANFGVGMVHHLGHGVGLQPHEYPHLGPKWDDTLLEGEIVTVEPGVYGPHLGGGLRLENTYLVGRQGLENLVNAPLEMT